MRRLGVRSPSSPPFIEIIQLLAVRPIFSLQVGHKVGHTELKPWRKVSLRPTCIVTPVPLTSSSGCVSHTSCKALSRGRNCGTACRRHFSLRPNAEQSLEQGLRTGSLPHSHETGGGS